MAMDSRARLAGIKNFNQLIEYLRKDLHWPLAADPFIVEEELFFDYTADELGIDVHNSAKILEIKRLRPLANNQPWGIFFIKFEPKRLPVVALRRILGQVAQKKRESSNSPERVAWSADDLLFISSYGEGDNRQITLAHFSSSADGKDLPTLKVLGWNNDDTPLHLDAVSRELNEKLQWPRIETDIQAWRIQWRGAFTVQHREVITTAKDLSIRLAALARAIRDRIILALDIETEKGPLTRLMTAFREALVHDLDARGFADMYAQTISYGLLSARITDPSKRSVDDLSHHMRTNPFLRELMETFIRVGGRKGKSGSKGIDFDELGVNDVVELLDAANMEAVIRDFGDRNWQEDPVIHFYELFLKEYDAKKRMQRGVFYTPRSVVSYIIHSVDELLRTDFDLADGLADTTTWGEMANRNKNLKIPNGVSPEQDFVQILDPATGTGTFLVEVIDKIYKTLDTKWKAQGHSAKKIDALWNDYVPKHLLTRLHGYELLMAPYAIAHLKIGLKLYETGYRFASDARARVFLTNALEPAQDFSDQFEFAIPALAHEADAVNEIKQYRRFTVLIGNPPYSVRSVNLNVWITGLVREYYVCEGHPMNERQPKALLDDYVKFVRFAQLQMELSGKGIVGLITNHGYLDNPTFRGMRYSLLQTFTSIRVVDLHGNTKRNERSADGTPDQNVFDIQQGVCISFFLVSQNDSRSMRRTDLFGTRDYKSALLHDGLATQTSWIQLHPESPFFLLSDSDSVISAEYERYASVAKLFVRNNVGFVTSRDSFVIDFDIAALKERIYQLSDVSVTDAEIGLRDTSSWSLKNARRSVHARKVVPSAFIRCMYRPFDFRWICYDQRLLDRPVFENSRHLLSGKNIGLIVSRQVTSDNYCHTNVSRNIIEFKAGSHDRNTQLCPLYLINDGDLLHPSVDTCSFTSNLNTEYAEVLTTALGTKLVKFGSGNLRTTIGPEDVLNYVYAILHAPYYRAKYSKQLRIDFPRVPIQLTLKLFRDLVQLGSELTALHLLESQKLDTFITEYIGSRNQVIEKVSWSNDTVWIDNAQSKGFNGVCGEVWEFHIGGYQVCNKWLKDRKGRTLSKDDIAHYQKIIVALSETIRLMKKIDEVIDLHGGWPGAFQSGASETTEAGAAPMAAEGRLSYENSRKPRKP